MDVQLHMYWICIVLLNTIVWLTSCLLEEKIILIKRLFVSVDLLWHNEKVVVTQLVSTKKYLKLPNSKSSAKTFHFVTDYVQ